MKALKAPGPNRWGSDVALGHWSVATDRLLLTDKLPARQPHGTDGQKWTADRLGIVSEGTSCPAPGPLTEVAG